MLPKVTGQGGRVLGGRVPGSSLVPHKGCQSGMGGPVGPLITRQPEWSARQWRFPWSA